MPELHQLLTCVDDFVPYAENKNTVVCVGKFDDTDMSAIRDILGRAHVEIKGHGLSMKGIVLEFADTVITPAMVALIMFVMWYPDEVEVSANRLGQFA